MSSAVPWGRTARRVQWAHLPPVVRQEVEERIGHRVVDAASQGGGFSPAFASVLTDAAGGRHFVKAASIRAQRALADACRQEADVLAALPPQVPAPRLRWTAEVADWFLLGIEYVEAVAPRRPWRRDELDRCLDVVTSASAVTPPAWLDTAEAEFAYWPARWTSIALDPARERRREEATGLASRYADVVAGRALVHGDVRDDHLLLTADGRVVLCDWNWPVRGAAWLDALLLLIGPRGDGIDVEQVMAAHPLLAAVPREDVDVVLALVTGYLLERSAQPAPPTSPHLREVQRWQGEACWGWLSQRRGWD